MRNLVQTVRLFLQGAPDKKTQTKLTKVLIEPQEISTAHHVHYWSLDGEHHVLTAPLCLAQELNAEQVIALKQRLADNLAEYDLAHTTLEFEYPQEQCRDG